MPDVAMPSHQPQTERFTLLINAGGRSRRMGEEKALMPVPGSGDPLVRHVAQRLWALTDDVILVANDERVCAALAPLAPRACLADVLPDMGPLGGLATGLAQCPGWALCVACDLPLVQPAVFRHLMALAQERDSQGTPRWDAVVPRVHGRPQPMHALYHRRCLPAIQAQLARNQRRTTDFLAQVRTRMVEEDELEPLDPGLRSFFNANTPNEWAQAVRLLRDSVVK